MSEATVINYDVDLPCWHWQTYMGDVGKFDNCPMRKKWHEGQEKMCPECGCKILYDEAQEHINK